jgi:hypothetical protein
VVDPLPVFNDGAIAVTRLFRGPSASYQWGSLHPSVRGSWQLGALITGHSALDSLQAAAELVVSKQCLTLEVTMSAVSPCRCR